jgi:hypothetical protein
VGVGSTALFQPRDWHIGVACSSHEITFCFMSAYIEVAVSSPGLDEKPEGYVSIPGGHSFSLSFFTVFAVHYLVCVR